MLDPGGHGVGTHPLREQHGIGVGAEELLGRRREVTSHPDDRQLRVGFDDGLCDPVHARLFHRRQDGVQAAVAVLDAAPVTLDPGVDQVEDLDLQVH